MKTRIIKEIKNHIPFTALAVLISIFAVLFIEYFLKKEIDKEVFHIFHFLHLIVSAMVTGALFYKYKPKIAQAFLIGVLGAIIIGSLSDIIFPYLGGVVLGVDLHFHLPLVEETSQTLFFAFLGSLLGIATKKTKIPHFIHVFLSVFASLFYVIVFSVTFEIFYFIGAFFVVLLAVVIPCCLSDIIFPLIFVKNSKK